MIPPFMLAPAARYAIVAALAAACAWQVQSWRYGAEISGMNERQAMAIADAHLTNQILADKLAAADKQAIAKLTEARHENDSLRRAVAAGTQRLRIKATCLPADPESPSVGDAGTAELGAEAGQDILDIRAGIIDLEARLIALQNYVSEIQLK